MAEVEALQIVDGTAEPFGEVAKIDLTLTVPVLDFQQFGKIIILYCRVGGKVPHEILNVH